MGTLRDENTRRMSNYVTSANCERPDVYSNDDRLLMVEGGNPLPYFHPTLTPTSTPRHNIHRYLSTWNIHYMQRHILGRFKRFMSVRLEQLRIIYCTEMMS